MDELAVRVETPLQRLLVEQVLAFAKELERAADDAPDGRVLDRCERVALSSGRESLRKALADTLESQAAAGEGKKGAHRSSPCGTRRRHKGRSPRSVVTAIGRISVRRAYFTCPGCGIGEYAADRRAGLEGGLSRQGRRVICWSGGRASFAEAAASLKEIGGWTVSDETIRLACQCESKAMASWRADSSGACEGFLAAEGLAEFQADAAKVNTEAGWRDAKIGIFARRPEGEPATSEDRAGRTLPPPTARVAFVGLESSEVFGARWRPWASRLGLGDPAALSVLGDGAEWIWNEAAVQFPGAAQVLDVYHAGEHLAAASRAIHGEGAEATAWWRESRRRMVADGWWGVCERIGEALVAHPGAACQAAVDGLTTYFGKHTGRMNYAHRLRTGRSIGSGMVEGAAKLRIGRRLKQTGARWKAANVPGVGELCSITYSSCWSAYWEAA